MTTQDMEPYELIQAIANKGLHLLVHFQNKRARAPRWLDQLQPYIEAVQQAMTVLTDHPQKLAQRHHVYVQDLLQFLFEQLTQLTHMQECDLPLHFSPENWIHHPLFHCINQHHLLLSQHVHAFFAECTPPEKAAAKHLQYVIRLYLEALSPAHFLQTNPQVLSEILNTQGKNLLQELYNLLSDLETNRFQISMTDSSAFQLGENIACTPGKVLFQNEMMELIYYCPQTPRVHCIPLLIIPPWINKYYILDLSPNNSFVRWLVAQGISVFIISWINPHAAYAQKSIFNYLDEGPRTAIHFIKTYLNVSQVNTLGFCIGGTLLAMLLAYNKAHHDTSIKSATFLASMIDFSDAGELGAFLDEEFITQIENEMHHQGYLSGRLMAACFNSLKAKELIWSFFIKHYLQGKKPAPFDMLFWNNDSTNMPAKMHSEYLRWMYLNNDLIKSEKIHLNHTPLNISAVEIPSFFIATEKDHIAPWKTVYKGFKLLGGAKYFILGGSGHIAGIINPPSQHKYSYRINHSLPATAEEWLTQAQEYPESWWPEWLLWLKTQSEQLISAAKFKDLMHHSLKDAPGDYVFQSEPF